ncbi:hypothetical protein ASD39_19160 [Sphingomonas sp. Root50]|nr:hypothetical protein ASD17_15815 [Sphingomonas sp. Root1294]KQY72070.1 hypothetical protein ASD39_19160 [Sphingomonas sp. Root50]KRB94661.1 hypothetical protein ASE22_01595 [Sphingomonas sp. Root720]
MTATGKRRKPDETIVPKDRIVHAATSLFAEKGLHGAGLREIARAAGVNGNMISYHFGSKEDLYATVIESTANALCAARIAILEELDHRYSPAAPPVQEIMHAFIHPVFLLIEEDGALWSDFIRAYRREMGTEIWYEVNARTLAPILRRFVSALHRSLPSASRADVSFVLELAAHSLTITTEVDVTSMKGDSLRTGRSLGALEKQLIESLSAAALRFSGSDTATATR